MKNADELRNPEETGAHASLSAPDARKAQPSRRELLRALGVAGADADTGNGSYSDVEGYTKARSVREIVRGFVDGVGGVGFSGEVGAVLF